MFAPAAQTFSHLFISVSQLVSQSVSQLFFCAPQSKEKNFFPSFLRFS